MNWPQHLFINLLSLPSEQTIWTNNVNVISILDHKSHLSWSWWCVQLSMSLLEDNHYSNHKMIKPMGSQKSLGQILSPFTVFCLDHHCIFNIKKTFWLTSFWWKNLLEMSLLKTFPFLCCVRSRLLYLFVKSHHDLSLPYL